MITWVFDVDGVLCNTGTSIDPEFATWFANWMTGRRVIFITGSTRDRMLEQIGQEVVNRSYMSFNCLGNSIWLQGRETLINQISLKQDEINWLNAAVNNSKFGTKTGNHIDIRPGSINLSVLGRNATLEQRAEYKAWDTVEQERKMLIESLVTQFPRFEAFIGGDTSIDICLRGANKGQCIDMIPNREQIYFFGDRCFKGGVDKPFADRCSEVLGDKVYEVNGYAQTWEILKELET